MKQTPAADADLSLGQDDKTTRQAGRVFVSKHVDDLVVESCPARLTQSNNENPIMGVGTILPDIREIEVLSDEEPILRCRRLPHNAIRRLALQTFYRD
jgi:hypothetical protein